MGHLNGVARALASAALFGLTTPVAKGLVAEVSPQLLAGLFYLGSGLGLGVLWFLTRKDRTRREAPLTRRDLAWLLAATFFGGVLAPPLQLFGLARTSASTASLLLNLEGILTSLIAWLVVGEHMNRRTALGAVFIFMGTLTLSAGGPPGRDALAGPLLVALACLAWAVDNNLTQRVSAGDPLQVAGLKGAVAGVVNVALGALTGAVWPGVPRVALSLSLGFVGYGLSLVLFVQALRLLGVARTSSYWALAPFVGAVAGVLLWRDPIGPAFALAGLLMAMGVWLHVTEDHAHSHTHEPLEHTHSHVHDDHHAHAHEPGVAPGEPHSHPHRHERLIHTHPHYPDIHHRHDHDR